MIVVPAKMSVMPRNCADCEYREYPQWCEVEALPILGRWINGDRESMMKADREINSMTGRPDWCPLKEVMPCVGDDAANATMDG